MTDLPISPPPVLPTNAPILTGSPWLTDPQDAQDGTSDAVKGVKGPDVPQAAPDAAASDSEVTA